MSGRGLEARFETTDGSRPDATPLAPGLGAQHRLPAFTLLDGGDVFDARGSPGGARGPSGLDLAARWVRDKLTLRDHTGDDEGRPAAEGRVRRDATRQLAGNPALASRMLAQKPVVVDVVADVAQMIAAGYPRAVSRRASGLFWDHPSWPEARVAIRADRLFLPDEAALVFHELGHAIHYLAFTAEERDLIYKVLRPTFGDRSSMDEVFAIYSERELLGEKGFTDLEKRAPGVYGFTRRQWDEGHLFAAFIRKLYFPNKPVVGDQGKGAHDRWKKFMAG